MVLVFVTQRSVEHFARGKFTLGADASVAAGPVGRQTEAAAGINAEIYSYSRSRGLFAGVALDGTVIAFDKKANNAFYNGEEVTTSEITSRQGELQLRVGAAFPRSVAASANTAGGVEPSQQQQCARRGTATAATAAGELGGVKTYPMEDAKPGQEPK